MLRSHVASAFACCTKHAPFVVNCCSAVSLIFVNKYLLQVCKFHFLGLLGALHMGITALLAVQQSQLDTSTAALSVLEVAFFTVVTLVSLVSMNLSLLVNHVGVYQISKIAMIPACCFLEFVLQRKRVTKYGAAAICVLIIGVIIATISDVSPSWAGTVAASVGVLSSASHNVACSVLTKKHGISSATLVRQTAPMQTATLLLAGPVMDKALMGSFPWQWTHWRAPLYDTCTTSLLSSCVLAAVVNLSLVACIKQYSASGTQVLGHTKTVLVLSISWLQHKANPNIVLWRQQLGAALAIAGMVGYGRAEQKPQKPQPAAEPSVPSAPSDEALPMPSKLAPGSAKECGAPRADP